MQVLLEIQDDNKEFILKLLKNLNFVKIVKEFNFANSNISRNLIDSLKEVEEYTQGKIKLKTAQEFLK